MVPWHFLILKETVVFSLWAPQLETQKSNGHHPKVMATPVAASSLYLYNKFIILSEYIRIRSTQTLVPRNFSDPVGSRNLYYLIWNVHDVIDYNLKVKGISEHLISFKSVSLVHMEGLFTKGVTPTVQVKVFKSWYWTQRKRLCGALVANTVYLPLWRLFFQKLTTHQPSTTWSVYSLSPHPKIQVE